MDHSRHFMRAMLGAAALCLALTGGAAAQLPAPTFSLQSDKHKTPEQIEHDKAIDNAYRSATQKIPDQTTPNDPWATVRTAPAAPAAPVKKKQAAAKKQQLSEGAKKPGE